MGKMLIDGELREKPSADDGRFVRLESGFRDWITLTASLTPTPRQEQST